MKKLVKSNRVGNSGGFSLVEVALAMGIVSFAMVSLMGMLPLGLSNFKQAMGNTIESQIVQNLSNDILLANFQSISTYSGSIYYYDNQGEFLSSSASGPAPANASYSAVVSAAVVSSSNSPVALNSTSSASTVTVTITNLSDRSAYAAQHLHQYSMIIANKGL